MHPTQTVHHDLRSLLESCGSYCTNGSMAEYWFDVPGSLWEICGSCHDEEIRYGYKLQFYTVIPPKKT